MSDLDTLTARILADARKPHDPSALTKCPCRKPGDCSNRVVECGHWCQRDEVGR